VCFRPAGAAADSHRVARRAAGERNERRLAAASTSCVFELDSADGRLSGELLFVFFKQL